MKEFGIASNPSNPSTLVPKYDTTSSVLHYSRASASRMNIGPLKKKKVMFDTNIKCSEDSEPALKGGVGLSCDFLAFANKKHFSSTTSIHGNDDIIFFCDWQPQLFGIDEDNIPSSEDEEGLFDIDWIDLDERAEALSASELDLWRRGSRAYLTDEELRDLWKRDQIPMYGRRARQKPILERDNHEKFECICDIDTKYSRHHVPHFDGGVEREGEELKTPHFKAFWENLKENADMTDLMQASDLFEKKTEEQQDEGMKGDYRYSPTFPSSTSKEIHKFREQMLATFRPLDCREVRRYRMSYAEALYLEMQEDQYLESAEFFKHLIIKDHFQQESAKHSSVRLRNNRPLLNKLVSFLKFAEKFSRRKEYHKEAMILLRSGKYFNDYEQNWWWVAEELYLRAVKVSQNSVIDGGKAEAIANYILGTFLLDCVHRVGPAQEHLWKARELSLGKDWNAGRILAREQRPLYEECSNYLCRALIAVSKELRASGKPEEALPLIHRSHKLCNESSTPKQSIEMETYFELGMTYQEVDMLDWAKVAFKKFIEIAKVENNARSLCEGYLEMALCFRSEGDMNRCHHYLMSYLHTAEANQDENLIAFANRYLGEFHLNSGNAKVAEEHFQKALQSFLQQCEEAREIPFNEWRPEHFSLMQDVELTRTLTGLALGEILTKPIFHLILKAGDPRNQKLLINWKNNNRERSPGIYEEIINEFTRQEALEIALEEDKAGGTQEDMSEMESTVNVLEALGKIEDSFINFHEF